ncbi:V-type ATP synthase subunit A [Amphritea balenae]|uniref:V-type ATP synthase alpha chain n=1 Tax=Amphritea balenae TaxID=452629 RepID=A0A3P1SWZ5_9GAMM|nr:V-type ATP synthase subunit A [Amphritea balenae]RRD01505.1 V-type ATP synthase subunit A [Amphritea balenae]
MSARTIRISGPVVVCDHAEQFAMGDRVAVGKVGLIGEVIRLTPTECFLQVYEDTTELFIGEPVTGSGSALAVELGPGLLTTIYDGIQRPLALIQEQLGASILQGAQAPALSRTQAWPFTPQQEIGTQLSGGAIIGLVQETPSVCHKILLPPGLAGQLVHIAEPGEYTLENPIARISCANGQEHPVYLYHRWPVRIKRPVQQRLSPDLPLITGQRIIDTLFPIAKGGTAAMPGGFGTGKTVTQHNLAKWCDADIIIYIGCGERGNEITGVLEDFPQLRDPRTGRPLIERTVMIANTSNMPVAAREASIYTGITIAEYFRDQGLDVALMADSTSRWAEALREISGRLEEMPAEEGFPAYLPSRTAEFYERAGRVRTLADETGSVTAIGAVSPPGGDFSEPVTLHTQRFVKAYWMLDKNLAYARFFPAIHPLESYSEYESDLAQWWEKVSPGWQRDRDELVGLLIAADQLKGIVRILGEEGLSDHQRKTLMAERVVKEGFLQQSAFSPKDRFASPEKQACLLRVIIWRIRALLEDTTPAREAFAKFKLNELIRLKDELGSDETEKILAWQKVQ